MADKQKRRFRVVVLNAEVLLVAIEGHCKDWAAYIALRSYIGAVAGNNHDRPDVLKHGNKLPQKVAEAIFPDFADLAWRD